VLLNDERGKTSSIQSRLEPPVSQLSSPRQGLLPPIVDIPTKLRWKSHAILCEHRFSFFLAKSDRRGRSVGRFWPACDCAGAMEDPGACGWRPTAVCLKRRFNFACGNPGSPRRSACGPRLAARGATPARIRCSLFLDFIQRKRIHRSMPSPAATKAHRSPAGDARIRAWACAGPRRSPLCRRRRPQRRG
jgi:hypothetical protein